MAGWRFTGSVRFDGMAFIVEADTLAEAIVKAEAGEYFELDEWDAKPGECQIDLASGKPNT